jgi:hypothetical protein
LKIGLIANPENSGFNISLAFGYASRNMVDEAEVELSRIKSTDPVREMQIITNRGLILFRKGDGLRGRELYVQAVEMAVNREDRTNATAAMIYWAREEILAGSGLARAILEKVVKTTDLTHTPHYA